MNIKTNNQKQYIHIERDNKEKHIIIDTKNISIEDTVYLLTEFIWFVSNQQNVPADGFMDIIKGAVRLKTELENKKGITFEEEIKSNNEILDFSEDEEEESNYKIDDDPLSKNIDTENRWDYDEDGDKVDKDGNKMLFVDEE